MANKTAIVIDSSSSLGLEICENLLDEGYIVFGASPNGCQLVHSHFLDCIVDVSDDNSVERFFDDISCDVGEGIDLFVNIPNISKTQMDNRGKSIGYLEYLFTNVLGSFHLLKYLRPFIIEDETHVITVSSNTSDNSSYQSSLNGFIESYKKEWDDLGVRFSTLVPEEHFEYSELSDDNQSIAEFIYIFNMIIKAPKNIQFPEITFLQRMNKNMNTTNPEWR